MHIFITIFFGILLYTNRNGPSTSTEPERNEAADDVIVLEHDSLDHEFNRIKLDQRIGINFPQHKLLLLGNFKLECEKIRYKQ